MSDIYVPGAIEKLKIGDALLSLDTLPWDLRQQYDRANLMLAGAKGADAVRVAKARRNDVIAEIVKRCAPEIAIKCAARSTVPWGTR
jgi:hypothetical protein